MSALILKCQIMMAFPWQRKLFFFFLRAVYASKNIYLPFHTKMNLIKSKLKKNQKATETKKKMGAHLRYICFRKHLKKQIWKLVH